MVLKPVISVVVCTRNRAGDLREAIQSVLRQDCDADAYEVLIVDNASTDHTQEVSQDLCRERWNVSYVYEALGGLSHARNRGLLVARGEYVAFLDDDAVAAPGWLSAILGAFATMPSDLGAVGGVVELEWRRGAPRWMEQRYERYFSGFFSGEESRVLHPGRGEFVVGCNMAFRREPLLELGGFVTSLGRSARSLLGGKEAEACIALQGRGYLVYYERSAWVRHRVGAERASLVYLLRRAFWEGTTLTMLAAQRDGSVGARTWVRARMRGLPFWIRSLASCLLRRDIRGLLFASVVVSERLGTAAPYISLCRPGKHDGLRDGSLKPHRDLAADTGCDGVIERAGC